MPRSVKIFLILPFIAVSLLQAQFKNILLDSIPDGNLRKSYPQEVSVAISPLDTNLVVIGANIDRVYRSYDGGRIWKYDRIASSLGVCGDPCILASSVDSQFYYFHLAILNKENGFITNFLEYLVCQSSADSGVTWSDGSKIGENLPKVQDKEWAVEDPSTGRIYVCWTQFDQYRSSDPEHESNIMVSWSDDRGKTWSEALQINQRPGECNDNDFTAEGAIPAVGPNSEVYVAWAKDELIFFDKSLDAGQTWMENDRVLSPQPGGWFQLVPGTYRCGGMPITLCDLSNGPNHGTVYVCWSDSRNGKDNLDIWLIKSTDRGNSWSQPVRINDDTTRTHQFFPWLTIDQSTGYLYCLYYDRSHNLPDSTITNVRLTFSTDGGDSFKSVRINENSFSSEDGAFWGDYIGVSAVQGKIIPVWTQVFDKTKTSIWTTVLSHSSLEKAASKN